MWIEFAVRCGYLPADVARTLYRSYDEILATLVGMITHPETWTIPNPRQP